jgi:hypothetical protein
LSIDGRWIIYYDWGCTGTYHNAGINFSPDGTFSVPEQGFIGKWIQNDGMILFQFDDSKTTYGGNITGNAMVGVSSDFERIKGCWYAIKEGSIITPSEEHKPEFDLTGKKAI